MNVKTVRFINGVLNVSQDRLGEEKFYKEHDFSSAIEMVSKFNYLSKYHNLGYKIFKGKGGGYELHSKESLYNSLPEPVDPKIIDILYDEKGHPMNVVRRIVDFLSKKNKTVSIPEFLYNYIGYNSEKLLLDGLRRFLRERKTDNSKRISVNVKFTINERKELLKFYILDVRK